MPVFLAACQPAPKPAATARPARRSAQEGENGKQEDSGNGELPEARVEKPYEPAHEMPEEVETGSKKGQAEKPGEQAPALVDLETLGRAAPLD